MMLIVFLTGTLVNNDLTSKEQTGNQHLITWVVLI